MANERTTSRQQLEERIAYLQSTLARLTEQLEAQDRFASQLSDGGSVQAGAQRSATPPPNYNEMPLPIAAG